MSTAKGSGGQKKGGQKYQNKFTFMHNRKSTKTANIMKIKNDGVCQRCFDIIEWRKKYRKYKELKNSSKCLGCNQRTVMFAYHDYCGNCATERNVCAKCRQPKDLVEPVMTEDELRKHEIEERESLANMRPKDRKKYERMLERGEFDGDDESDIDEDEDEDDVGTTDQNTAVTSKVMNEKNIDGEVL